MIVGEDDQHAEALALPWHLSLVQHRAGNPAPLMSGEQAQRHRWSEAEQQAEPRVDRRADVVGGPERAATLLAAAIRDSGADEVIASTNTFDPAERRDSYERLAAVAGLTAAFTNRHAHP